MQHAYQAFERCVVLSRHGKVLCSTTDIHMWLQFYQLKISALVEALRHLLMTYKSKTPLIFPKAKNSKTICVIVFHLE